MGHAAAAPLWALGLGAVIVLFVVPGLAGAAALARRQIVPPFAVALTAVVLSAALGYGFLWVYLLDHNLGRVLSVVVMGASVLALIVPTTVRRLLWGAARDRQVALPLVLMFVVALFYNGILLAHGSHTAAAQRAQLHVMNGDDFISDRERRPLGGFPIDNFIPYLFAEHLYDGTDPRELFGDWRSSDRPPLQTGIVLSQMPLGMATSSAAEHYQLFSSALQCTWVVAVWALCGAARFPRRATALALGLAAFSGFFWLNSVFTWPKLLAGSLALLAYALLMSVRTPGPSTVILAGLGAGLGMLAHSGVIFTLLPLGLVVMARRHRPRLGPALLAGVVVVLLFAPWQAYVRLYDPPGNRLLKWHLAGVTNIDERSVGRTLSDQYSEVGLSGAVDNKLENARILFGDRPPTGAPTTGTSNLRRQEYLYVGRSLGLMSGAWVGVLVLVAHRLLRRRRDPPQWWSGALVMLGVAGLALLTWVLMMFGPQQTVIHQGSYATMILLWVGLAGVVATWPRWLSMALLAAQAAWFTVVWALGVPGRSAPLNGWAILSALAAGAVLVGILVRLFYGVDETIDDTSPPSLVPAMAG